MLMRSEVKTLARKYRLPVINTSLRVCHSSTQTLTTKDGKTISISFVIGFSITDPVKALQAFTDLGNTFGALVGASSAEFVCVRNALDIHSSELASHAKAKLETLTDGVIAVEFVRSTDFAIAKTYRLLQEQWRPATSDLDGVR